ncbi:MAG TPA: choice-of-anchor D domain-containing protein [Bryobacteraceae bacterium]|jgi:hypothetical protein|nr:choice-of-anchor D domain-containing protein [Bryobacteraceae bacterium]
MRDSAEKLRLPYSGAEWKKTNSCLRATLGFVLSLWALPAISLSAQTTSTLEFSPAMFAFGGTKLGNPVYGVLTISNTGSTPVSFSSFTIGGPNAVDFSIVSNVCLKGSKSLPASSDCSLTVRFIPTITDLESANLTIADSGSDSPQVIVLGGLGITVPVKATLAFQQLALWFGTLSIGKTSPASSLVVTNTGATPVDFSSIAIAGPSGSDFAISSNQCTAANSTILGPKKSCSVSVTFTPTAEGVRTAKLTFTDNASRSPQSIPLTGNRNTGLLSLSIPGYFFGAAEVGTGVDFVPGPNAVTNNGSTPVKITSVRISGANASQFHLYDECSGHTLPPFGIAGCAVRLYFQPTYIGVFTASLVITTDPPATNLVVPISGTGAKASALKFSLPGVSFGGQDVLTHSAPVTVALSNPGVETVLFQLGIDGRFSSDDYTATPEYFIGPNTCTIVDSSFRLPGGGSCAVSLTFFPNAPGLRTARLTIGDNFSMVATSIPLTGVGITTSASEHLIFAPEWLSFSAALGSSSAPQSFTLVNVSKDDLNVYVGPIDRGDLGGGFTISSSSTCGFEDTFTISPGQFCELQVTFRPDSLESTAVELVIAYSDNEVSSTSTVELYGIGQSPSKTLSVPASLTFKPQAFGIASAPQAITIQNTGNAPIDFTGFAITGSRSNFFAIASNSCPPSLAVSDACTIGVIFTPGKDVQTATLAITDDAVGSPHSIALTGTSVTARNALQVPPAAAFGALDVGAKSALPVQILNVGNATSSVRVSDYRLTGANATDFAISANTCTTSYGNRIPPGARCSLKIQFAPAAAGLRTGSLQITNDGSGSPETTLLTGVGQTKDASLSLFPDGVSFGTSVVGISSASQLVKVTNIGNTAVQLRYTISGSNAADFSISKNLCSNLGNMLPAGDACTLSLALKPSAAGGRTARLQITDVLSGTVQSITLEGLGQTPLTSGVLTVSPSFYDYGLLGVHLSSTEVFTLTNIGNASITFPSYPVSGPNAADFTITANTCSSHFSNVLPSQNTCSLKVVFAPSATGIRSAALTLTDLETQASAPIVLSGVGSTKKRSIAFLVNGASGITQIAFEGLAGSALREITAVNTGDVNIKISDVSIGGLIYVSIRSNTCPSVLTPGGQCDIVIGFDPYEASHPPTPSIGYLIFDDDLPGSPQSLLLTVPSPAPQALSWPVDLVFTSPIGVQTLPKYAYLTKTGAGSAVPQAEMGGPNASDFSVTPYQCADGSPVGTCVAGVRFRPSRAGVETATLYTFDYDGISLSEVNLAGLGQTGEKALAVSTDFLRYSQVPVGVTQTGQLHLSSSSNTAVTLAKLSISGPNASEFAIAPSTTCQIGTPIQRTGCNIGVQFVPAAEGLRTGTLQLADDATGATQDVLLIGSASVPSATVTASYVDFGRLAVNTTSQQGVLYFRNSSAFSVALGNIQIDGPAANSFAMASNTCGESLAANASCQANVTFTPVQAGPEGAAVQLSYSGGTGTVADAILSGAGNGGAGYIAASALGIEYDDSVIDTTVIKPIRLTNTGEGTVHFNGFRLVGANAADFSLFSNDCPSDLAPLASCTTNIRFKPSTYLLRTAALQINDDAANTPQRIGLAGAGQPGKNVFGAYNSYGSVAAVSSLDFGIVPLNTTAQSVNTFSLLAGGDTIDLANIQVTGPNASEFTIVSNTCGTILTSNSACQMTIQYVPSAAGLQDANLVITSNAAGSPFTLPLTGTGESSSASLLVQYANLDFGFEPVGTSSAVESVNILETGSATVAFGKPTITGPNASDFSAVNGTCTTEVSNSACYILVGFTPSAPGPRTATLLINDDAPGSPQKITLNGTGLVVNSGFISASAHTLDFGIIHQGALSKTLPLALTNNGGSIVNVKNISISGANAADFQISQAGGPNPCFTAIGSQPDANSCNLYLQFIPATSTTETATLVVTTNAANRHVLVSLFGRGQAVRKSITPFPETLDFGISYTGVATSGSQVTILNTGDATVNLGAPMVTGAQADDFTIDQNKCVGPIGAGASCTIALHFTASIPAFESATLTVVGDQGDATQTSLAVTLTGTGVVKP